MGSRFWVAPTIMDKLPVGVPEWSLYTRPIAPPRPVDLPVLAVTLHALARTVAGADLSHRQQRQSRQPV